MDIYKYAEEYDADYYDYNTGYIYLVQDYNKEVRSGNEDAKIKIRDDSGRIIGTARKN